MPPGMVRASRNTASSPASSGGAPSPLSKEPAAMAPTVSYPVWDSSPVTVYARLHPLTGLLSLILSDSSPPPLSCSIHYPST
eukprot:2882981-Alexandrium_andersonii.AAC.1